MQSENAYSKHMSLECGFCGLLSDDVRAQALEERAEQDREERRLALKQKNRQQIAARQLAGAVAPRLSLACQK